MRHEIQKEAKKKRKSYEKLKRERKPEKKRFEIAAFPMFAQVAKRTMSSIMSSLMSSLMSLLMSSLVSH